MPPLRGSLDISQTSGAAQLALAGHTKRAPPRSSDSARLNLRLFVKYRGGAQGIKSQNPNPKTREAGNARLAKTKKEKRAQSAHKTAFALPSPVRRRVAQDGRGSPTNMFEHVAAQRIVRVYEEARPFEQRREPRSGGAPGAPFLL